MPHERLNAQELVKKLFYMSKYVLYYAELNNHEDIPCFKYDDKLLMINKIIDLLIANKASNKKVVYLICMKEEIFITENENNFIDYMLSFLYSVLNTNIIHFHEYESYESAYSVALSMREPNPLCYDK